MSVSSFAPSLNNGHDSPIITSSSSSSSHPIMSHHSHEFPMFRSETMSMIRIIMTDDIAVDTMRELGHMGKVHLIDQTTKQTVLSDHSLYYKKRVALCGYWERKLDSFKDAMREFDVEIPGPEIIPVERRYGDVVDAIKNYLEPLESSLGKNILFRRQHYQLINEYIERQWVLQLCYDREISGAHGRDRARAEDMNDGSSSESGYGSFDQDQTALLASDNEMKGSVELEEARQRAGNFSSSISGVVPVDRQPFFERMLFRVSRGNVLSRFTPIDVDVVDPATAIPMRKAVFTVIFMGQQMKRRISKIIQYFGATEYDVPTSTRDYLLQQREIVDRLKEYRMILNRTDQEVHEMLSAMAFNRDQPDISPLIDWYAAIRKEKGVCDALRKCEVEGATSKMLTVTGWIPAENLDELNFYLERAVRETKLQKAAVNIISPRGMPPTYIRTNKFTSSYQTIVDTYGVPRYKEVNPGLFTIITFPFLFGVMYGDIGHGMGLTLFAMFMIWKERQYDEQLRRGNMNEIFGMAYGGRYMLLLMGMFAVYVGFIYNDCVSIPLRLFDTTWYHKKNDPVAVSTGQVYPFGVDPSWYHTENELAFFNSMKMKMSVTLGVIQMSFGIFLSLLNHLYNHDRVSVWFEFIPRIVFMLSVFGYMIFLIFIKWIIDWNKRSIQPPSLVQTMIAMFLQPGTVDEDKQIFPGQASIQVLLLLAAFISVPFMLLGPPLASRAQFRKKYGKGYKPVPVHHDDDDEDIENSYSHDDEKTDESSEELIHKTRVKRAPVHEHVMEEEEEVGHGHGTVGPHYNFNDHLITQGIHTIEFVLGAVSNTASYLRLWALSLAHAELAGVFWSKMVMQYGIDTGNVYMVFTGVAVWAMASFAVLLCMDVLECFLHALRLHWVEFQNKFFAADGYAFEPFSFENITKED